MAGAELRRAAFGSAALWRFDRGELTLSLLWNVSARTLFYNSTNIQRRIRIEIV